MFSRIYITNFFTVKIELNTRVRNYGSKTVHVYITIFSIIIMYSRDVIPRLSTKKNSN